jgi:hypothetical protein
VTTNLEQQDAMFKAAFDRLLPELYDVPSSPNGVPLGHIDTPGGISTHTEWDGIHPYAAMYRRAMEQAT